MANALDVEIDLTTNDYKKVGTVYRQGDNDYLICYNNEGLCALNVDEQESYYEMMGSTKARDVISNGVLIADNIQSYLYNRGG